MSKISIYNASHCLDTTAYLALSNIEREHSKRRRAERMTKASNEKRRRSGRELTGAVRTVSNNSGWRASDVSFDGLPFIIVQPKSARSLESR